MQWSITRRMRMAAYTPGEYVLGGLADIHHWYLATRQHFTKHRAVRAHFLGYVRWKPWTRRARYSVHTSIFQASLCNLTMYKTIFLFSKRRIRIKTCGEMLLLTVSVTVRQLENGKYLPSFPVFIYLKAHKYTILKLPHSDRHRFLYVSLRIKKWIYTLICWYLVWIQTLETCFKLARDECDVFLYDKDGVAGCIVECRQLTILDRQINF